jgi:Concanavalin A-like lectin/glucanases superfamily/Right handed beta helix region
MRRVLLLVACLSLWLVAVASGATRYVATTGSDTADGSTGSPYQHIQKCATVSVSGDICLIRAGTYRETVTPAANGITFQPDGSAIVTVSGADLVTGWTVHSGNIYKSTGMTWTLGVSFNQVFVDGQAMNLARFPNASLDLSNPTWLTADSSVPTADIETSTFEIFDSALTQANGFWNGAEVTHMAAGMYSMAGTVSSYTTGHIVGDNPHVQARFMESPMGQQYKYYLSNKLAALDTGGEWYFDGTTLYLWTPDNSNPTGHTVEAKRRQFAFDLSGRSNITIRNLKLFASSINMSPSSSNNVLDGIDAKYVWHQLRNMPAAGIGQTDPKWGAWNTGIILAGTDNILKNCTIAWSSHNGVYLRNTHQTVENCTIHDVQYLASEGGAVSWMGDTSTGGSTSGHVVRQNTMYNSGRHLVNHYYAQNVLITNNLMYDFCLTAGDCGATYTVKPEASGTISYNVVHDTHSPYFNFGLYMDDEANSWLVHHNVVWTNTGGCGIVYKASNFQIYNNTVNDSGTGICAQGSGSNVVIANNLGNSGIPSGNDNLQTTNAGYVNEAAHNYQLTSGSPAVNTGHFISGITTNCVNQCDIGAYEFGTAAWTAGATPVTGPTCPAGCTCTVTAGVCDGPPVCPAGCTCTVAGVCDNPTCPPTCTCTAVPGTCDTGGGGLGPVAWWKFEEGSGTTANDSSGNNKHGTLSGPIWVAGRIGNFALQFDGINDAVFLPAAVLPSMNGDQTVCLWAFTPDVTQPGNQGFRHTLLQLWQDDLNGVRMVVTDETAPPGLWAISTTVAGTESSRQTTTQAFVNNTWVHVCYTREVGTFVLYTNGQAQPTTDPGGYSLGDSSYLGQRTATGGQFNGRLDQVKVWSRSLSAAEIQSEFTGTSVTPATAPHHRAMVR